MSANHNQNHFNKNTTTFVSIIASLVCLIYVFGLDKKILPVPWNIVVVILIEVPCLIYLILYLVKKIK